MKHYVSNLRGAIERENQMFLLEMEVLSSSINQQFQRAQQRANTSSARLRELMEREKRFSSTDN